MVFGRRYRVTEKIGSGGMAEVYKAVDEVLGRTVAVKVMHPRYAADETFAARFRQEAQAAANLQSPYIVNMYDWGQDGSTYYIVMEYLRGADLKSLITQHGALDSRKVAEIGVQVCSALSVAHGYDVIHRDIKPHNIMVGADGVKVTDFGIARAGNTTMTQTGSVLGTAHYVSPEQAQGRPLTAASDLYSLGVVLYEAATGRLPFDADSPVAVALKQVNEAPRPPHEIVPSIDPGLEAVILTALAKRPTDRYDTADQMRQDLQRVIEGQTVRAVPVAAPVPGPAANETAVMPSVPAAGAAPVMRPAPARKKKPVWPWIVLAIVLVAAGLGTAWAMGLLGPQGVPVPELVGLQVDEATAKITEAGFTVGEVTEEFNADVEIGEVTDQSPVALAEAEKGSAISITVSKGPKMVEVPKITGMKEEKARQALVDAGLSPNPASDEYSSKHDAGVVFKQTPKAGEKAEDGSAVSYVVSRGPKTVTVPNVKGKSQSSATATLKDKGFKVSPSEAWSETVAAGKVISQNPGSGIVVVEGSTVSIVVSKGSELVEVPDVIGSTQEEATATLESAGFTVSVTLRAALRGRHGARPDAEGTDQAQARLHRGDRRRRGRALSATDANGREPDVPARESLRGGAQPPEPHRLPRAEHGRGARLRRR